MAQTFADFQKEQEGNVTDTTKVEGSPEITPKVEVPPVPAAGNEAVTEPMVTIDGKPRPLKNYEAELRRKFDKEKEDEIARIKSEYENKPQAPYQQPTPQPSYLEQIYQMAETERLTTGKDVPIQTIMQVASHISQRNLEHTLQQRETAEREKRSFKRSIRKDPDFAEVEEEFDTLVDQLKPEQVNPAVLDVVYNAARGKKWTKEREEQIRKQAKADALKDKEILNAPVESQPSTGKPKTSLTPEQLAEFTSLNHESTNQYTEQEYLGMIKGKQDRFKVAGARNIPQLMSDTMIR